MTEKLTIQSVFQKASVLIPDIEKLGIRKQQGKNCAVFAVGISIAYFNPEINYRTYNWYRDHLAISMLSGAKREGVTIDNTFSYYEGMKFCLTHVTCHRNKDAIITDLKMGVPIHFGIGIGNDFLNQFIIKETYDYIEKHALTIIGTYKNYFVVQDTFGKHRHAEGKGYCLMDMDYCINNATVFMRGIFKNEQATKLASKLSTPTSIVTFSPYIIRRVK